MGMENWIERLKINIKSILVIATMNIIKKKENSIDAKY